ncbi:glutathionylspermidine synthase family protein [Viridibacillus arvi]|uniref:glutathionylspermidine synthase family protein n=1 Tax=Viridibacillus arvi TaxID=263475 RepID=UPI0034CEBF0C
MISNKTISLYNTSTYLNKWMEIQNELSTKGFTWASLLENEEWNQYMSLDVLPFTKEEIEEIQSDTLKFSQLVQSTYRLVMKYPKYFSMLGLPINTWECAAEEWLYLFSYFCRYDIIHTKQGNKFIEINSDTPTGYLETSVANEALCKIANFASPNNLEKAIEQAWHMIIRDYNIKENETIFFTSLGWHDEDKQTVLFNQKNCPQSYTEYIEIEEIVVNEDGIYTTDGRKINFLYRLYPIEYFVDDTDENGKQVGLMLLDHVVNKKVKLINPMSAFVTQSKALLLVMWHILENEPHLYTKEEQEWVKKYVPRTYHTNVNFKDEKYVVKPLLGREGGGVSIIEQDGTIEEEDTTPEYYNQKKIYQEYIEMPEITVETWDEPYTGKLLIGSFLIGGEPSGVFLRVGGKITGNLSMFVGIGIEE